MARLTRAEVFGPNEIAVVHVISRVVRRCFLMGFDPVSQKNFDHRKSWIEARLQLLAAHFGIDVLGFSILSNHFHLILRSRPDVVGLWDDTEIARRWLMLCPVHKKHDGTAEDPSEPELNTIRKNPITLAKIRTRLSDIAWWMRLLCQHVAVRANREDGEDGKFFQSRYRAIRLCDEEAILACSAYVDLNLIRAAMAETIEESDFTSVQRRIKSLRSDTAESIDRPTTSQPDRWLAPLTIDELRDSIKALPSHEQYRCSDKGFLSMSIIDYIELLDWTARQMVSGKRGATAQDTPPVLERLSLNNKTWFTLVKNFGKLFYHVAGRPTIIDNSRSRVRHRRFYLRRQTRELLATQA